MEFGIGHKYNFPLTSDPSGSGKCSCYSAPSDWVAKAHGRLPRWWETETGYSAVAEHLRLIWADHRGAPVHLLGDPAARSPRRIHTEVLAELILNSGLLWPRIPSQRVAAGALSYVPRFKFGPFCLLTAFPRSSLHRELILKLKKDNQLNRLAFSYKAGDFLAGHGRWNVSQIWFTLQSGWLIWFIQQPMPILRDEVSWRLIYNANIMLQVFIIILAFVFNKRQQLNNKWEMRLLNIGFQLLSQLNSL